MKKRLRKKQRLGEFREDVFAVRLSLRDGLDAKRRDEFLWRFLEDAIEAQGLACGGGGNGPTWEFQVQLARRGSPSEEQRAAVGAWLERQPEVSAYTLGELRDGARGEGNALPLA